MRYFSLDKKLKSKLISYWWADLLSRWTSLCVTIQSPHHIRPARRGSAQTVSQLTFSHSWSFPFVRQADVDFTEETRTKTIPTSLCDVLMWTGTKADREYSSVLAEINTYNYLIIFQKASLNHKWSICLMNLKIHDTITQQHPAPPLSCLLYWSAGRRKPELHSTQWADVSVNKCSSFQEITCDWLESACAYQWNQQAGRLKWLPPKGRGRSEAQIWGQNTVCCTRSFIILNVWAFRTTSTFLNWQHD